MSVHIFCFIFGVHNGLILVKAIISRCCIADRYCDQIEGYSLNPNISKAIRIEVIGQLVTPQKTAAIPQAAQIDGEIPIRLPITQPKVAPMQKEGTISPRGILRA